MIAEWNENTKGQFVPSWVSCIDESMSNWFSRWTCPEWKFAPRKPCLFGNEYHSIICGVTTILFAIEVVEGKDRLQEKKDNFTKKRGNCIAFFASMQEFFFNWKGCHSQ